LPMRQLHLSILPYSPPLPLFPYTTLFRSALIAMRPNVISPTQNSRAGRVENVQPAIDPASARVKVIETRKGGGGKLDLAEAPVIDRKSTRLNSSHGSISYAVFCLKKKRTT